MEKTPVLRLERLDVAFPIGPDKWLNAASGVDLTLSQGEVLGLIGESGSGKSTVLNAIAGLLPVGAKIAGQLHLDGESGDVLSDAHARARIAGRRIGMIFQNPAASLNPVLTIGSQIAEVAMVHQALDKKTAATMAVDLMDRVGIDDAKARAASFPHQLSGGQKQRVAIAAALAAGPNLLLADEPTTALDALVQAQIFDILLDLVDTERLGLILVTHDLAIAGSVADRIAVMFAGRIVETGPANAVVRTPGHPYGRVLADAALPFTASDTARLSDLSEHATSDEPRLTAGCAFAPRCPLRQSRCVEDRPTLRPWREHEVACWRAGEAT